MWRPERWTESRGLPAARARSALRTRRRRRSKRERCAMAISSCLLCGRYTRRDTYALALVRLGLAPAANFGRDLTDLLLVDAADLDRVLVGSLDVDAFRHREIDVV